MLEPLQQALGLSVALSMFDLGVVPRQIDAPCVLGKSCSCRRSVGITPT